MPEIQRDATGVCVSTALYQVHLHPVVAFPSEPVSMFVRVFATAELVGYDEDWLHDDKMRGFAFEEIVVTDTHLECWRPPNPPSSQAKAFRKGFSLGLEPGMAEALRAWIPPIRRIARVTHAISKEISGTRNRTLTRNEQTRVAQVVSARVFDACAPDRAVSLALGYAPPWLQIEMGRPTIMALLASAGTDFKALATKG
jgi:hypothetical protein